MVGIPKMFISKGLEATENAKAVVAKIEKAVKQEIITPNKLVREPDSDLFEKASYMTKEDFWNDYSNAMMNEANRHRLGLSVSEQYANDTFVFDAGTGRVKSHSYKDTSVPYEQKVIDNFAEDGRSVTSRSKIYTYDDGVPCSENVEYYDHNGNLEMYETYNYRNGRTLDERFKYLPDGYKRSVKYDNGKPFKITRFTPEGYADRNIDLSPNGTIEKYVKDYNRLI